jgi:lysophospholipase L1-like esterase
LCPDLILPFAAMKITCKSSFLICLSLLIFSNVGFGQAFNEDIQAFKKSDSAAPPPKHAILFVGSSSFTNWKNVQDYFPEYTIINRGFGGSSLPDVIRYAPDIIFPYHPKQIIIYCGENDLAGDSSVTGKVVFKRFVQLFELIRKKLPHTPIAFVSLKPSPSRWNLAPEMTDANKRIKRYLRLKEKTAFVNVYSLMLNEHGKPLSEIFLADKLHMNATGYRIWQKAIEPILVK